MTEAEQGRTRPPNARGDLWVVYGRIRYARSSGGQNAIRGTIIQLGHPASRILAVNWGVHGPTYKIKMLYTWKNERDKNSRKEIVKRYLRWHIA
jgi:hypothetical protein